MRRKFFKVGFTPDEVRQLRAYQAEVEAECIEDAIGDLAMRALRAHRIVMPKRPARLAPRSYVDDVEDMCAGERLANGYR